MSARTIFPSCGVQRLPSGEAKFRVWAPKAQRVTLTRGIDGKRTTPLTSTGDGHFEAVVPPVIAGELYAYRLNDGSPRPDPRSLSQPLGVHSPSAVVWPEEFPWTDQEWRGLPQSQLILYELHVGTFTREGNFDGAISRLPELVALGVTAIEVMPVAPYPGRRGWGYDGVALFGVHESYGGPQAFQRFIDACHGQGLAVILDMVYNHLGPEGNYLREFGPYFTERHHTPWGAAVNYDGADAGPVRRFVIDNVRQWICDFHIDGLRLDAIQTILDDSPETIVAEIARVAREESARLGRPLHIIGETDENDAKLITAAEDGGWGLTAVWSDDFHHSVHAYLTTERGGYYADFGQPHQIAKALRENFVFDGAPSQFRGRNHGTVASHLPTDRFMICIQNHDQVGNRAEGDRLSTLLTPAQLRLAAGLLLLAPGMPLLFMGEEYGEPRPFPFFSDFQDRRMAASVVAGRTREFVNMGWKGKIPNPQAVETFESAILSWDWSDPSQAGLRQLYQTLLKARRNWPAMQHPRAPRVELPEAGEQASVLRMERTNPEEDQRVVAFFNLSHETRTYLLPQDPSLSFCLSSEDNTYSGTTTSPREPGQLRPHEFQVFTSATEALVRH